MHQQITQQKRKKNVYFEELHETIDNMRNNNERSEWKSS